MRRLGRRLLLLQAKSYGSENSKYTALFIAIVLMSRLLVIRSCSHIEINHTPTTRLFTTNGHFIWQQEGTVSITATSTTDENKMHVVDGAAESTNSKYWVHEELFGLGGVGKLINIDSVNQFIDAQTKKTIATEAELEGSYMPSDFFPYSCNMSVVKQFWHSLKATKSNRRKQVLQNVAPIHACAGVSGIGKTTFVMRGIDAIRQTDLYRNDTDEELKQLFSNRIYLPLSMTALGPDLPNHYDDNILGRVLLYSYINFHLDKDVKFSDVPDIKSNLVLEVLKARHKPNVMVIAHIDNAQMVIDNNWSDNKRRNSWIYGALQRLYSAVIDEKELWMIPFISGTNAVGISKLKLLGCVPYEEYQLSLFDVEDQIAVMNSIVPSDCQIQMDDCYNLRLFLKLLSGHPIILGLFMCYASYQFSKPAVQQDLLAHRAILPFTMDGWRKFTSEKHYNNKNVMWHIFDRISPAIFRQTRFSYMVNPLLGNVNNLELCMAVLYHCLLSPSYINRMDLVDGKITFGDLEDNGAVFLHHDGVGLRPVLPCFFISEIVIKIVKSNRLPTFPLLNYKPTFGPDENEVNDASVEILWWFGRFAAGFADSLQYRSYQLLKPKAWNITALNARKTLMEIVKYPNGPSVAFLNGKGASMTDCCLVFTVAGHPSIKYYAVLLQSKLKTSIRHHKSKAEDKLQIELGNVFESELPVDTDFEFTLITDVVDVDDTLIDDPRCANVPVNIFVTSKPSERAMQNAPNIQKKDQKEFYGEIISIWKELKVNWSRNDVAVD